MAITAMVLFASIFRYRNFNVLIGKCGRSCLWSYNRYHCKTLVLFSSRAYS